MSDDTDCGRCNGDGTIEANVADLLCPACHDGVCTWCNQRFDDGERLGDTHLEVCRSCIRDMATYKEDVVYQFALANELNDHVDDPDALMADISEAHVNVFDAHGIELTNPNEWDVRPAEDSR